MKKKLSTLRNLRNRVVFFSKESINNLNKFIKSSNHSLFVTSKLFIFTLEISFKIFTIYNNTFSYLKKDIAKMRISHFGYAFIKTIFTGLDSNRICTSVLSEFFIIFKSNLKKSKKL